MHVLIWPWTTRQLGSLCWSVSQSASPMEALQACSGASYRPSLVMQRLWRVWPKVSQALDLSNAIHSNLNAFSGKHGANSWWSISLGLRVRSSPISTNPVLRFGMDVYSRMASKCGKQCVCPRNSDRGHHQCYEAGLRSHQLADHSDHACVHARNYRLQHVRYTHLSSAGDRQSSRTHRWILRCHHSTLGALPEELGT